MKFSEIQKLLTEIVKFNLSEYERQLTTGRHDTNAFVVPFIMGDPGLGKTALPKLVARNTDLAYFQTIVAQHDAGIMAGLPFLDEYEVHHKDENGNVTDVEKRSRMIQIRPSYLPDIEKEEEKLGIWNLDELPQAYLANLNICSQIVNEWRVGDHHISRGITIVCTGNKPSNRAGTTPLPSHLKDRLMFVELVVDVDDWLQWASTPVDPSIGEARINSDIRAYINRYNGSLHPTFNPQADINTTPRSWEKINAIMTMDLPEKVRGQAFAGTIAPGEAVQFEAFLRMKDKLPDTDYVIANPQSAPVFGSENADVCYLLMTALADKAKAKNIQNILDYMARLPNKEFVTVFAKDAFNRDPSLLETKEVTKWKMTDGAALLI